MAAWSRRSSAVAAAGAMVGAVASREATAALRLGPGAASRLAAGCAAAGTVAVRACTQDGGLGLQGWVTMDSCLHKACASSAALTCLYDTRAVSLWSIHTAQVHAQQMPSKYLQRGLPASTACIQWLQLSCMLHSKFSCI